jgi:hypothetical protein
MHTGQEFIRHEFDEAIAVQQSIVDGAGELAQVHPLPDGKKQLQAVARDAERWLKRLKKRGQQFGATGEKEDVAEAIDKLAKKTLKSARGGEPSEVYEAQAVILNALRKQQDSAGAVVKIARSLKDKQMADEASEMQKATKSSADDLSKDLAKLAVVIAKDEATVSAA